MGQNLEQFRANKRGWDEFLFGALFLALDKPKLSAEQKQEWVSDLQTLKGRTKEEYEEIAAAIEWAVKVSPEWPRYIRRMKNVVDNMDERIMRDFRAEMRAQRNADRLEHGEAVTPACQALRDKHPHKTDQQILLLEPKLRMARLWYPAIKKCAACKGKYWVKSDRANIKSKVGCKVCLDLKEKLFQQHYKEVKEELYAKVTTASA